MGSRIIRTEDLSTHADTGSAGCHRSLDDAKQLLE
jgi:hypothetical protein